MAATEGSHRVNNRNGGVGPVHQIKRERLQPQPAQAIVKSEMHTFRTAIAKRLGTPSRSLLTPRHAKLRTNRHLGSEFAESVSQPLLRSSKSVHVCCVEDCNPLAVGS